MAKRNNLESIAFLTKDFHVYPDFHGNRSPIADPSIKGMVTVISVFNYWLKYTIKFYNFFYYKSKTLYTLKQWNVPFDNHLGEYIKTTFAIF